MSGRGTDFGSTFPPPRFNGKGLDQPGRDVGTGPGAMIALFAAFGIAAVFVCERMYL
ncbi:MAG: hypothetical protein KDK08_11385 [Rhizobiaceae bacterium]|nr:hypothetical protein [Rhizobiaceae bacterium]|tara:strand:- start:47222 stop:47392 length:171 start_codon:yes stop_codon:yes gene_type:complete